MPVLFIYILKLSVSLAVVFLFYQLVLRKLTFYNSNRWYLLAYTILSFFIPFIDISRAVSSNQWEEIKIVQWVPVINNTSIVPGIEDQTGSVSYWFVIGSLIIAGIVFMLLRLLIQFISFRQMIKKAELISAKRMKIYQVNESIIPFSFGNSVFINRHLHSEDELQEIIRHEFVHVKQRHSLDIIWGEILCLLNWYNPFAWLLKRSIRQNLEFIADGKVINNGVDRKQYQYLLLKVIGNNHFSIASKFNFSSLKKRIAMMNKIKSAKLNLVRFLFILPLIAILLLAFRNRTLENQTQKKDTVPFISEDATDFPVFNRSMDTVPKAPKVSPTTISGNHKDISTVSDDFEITNERAVIHLRNGDTEEYDLKNKEQLKKFEEKYGKVINTTVHTGLMAPVSVITADGIKTAIAPISVINTSVNGTVATTVATNSNINSLVAIATTSNVKGTTAIVSPVAATDAIAVVGDYDYAITGKEDILVTITRNTTTDQLEEFKKQMKEKGIELNFDKTIFNTKGVLTHISGTMKSADGKSKNTFSATDFKELILATIKDGDRTYIKVSVKDNKKVVI